MNYRLVVGHLGLLFALLGVIMIATAGIFTLAEVFEIRRDTEQSALLALAATGGVGAVLGWLGWVLTRNAPGYLGRREALLLVASSWLVGAALAAAPYVVWAHLSPNAADHAFRSPVNAYFESMSGLTTTGATVLTDIESMPSALLLWRALTHWLGGLGIVVLFVAVLPGLGVGGKRIFNVEAPGPTPEGLQPHIRETARWLWFIYLGLSVAMISALWTATPMDLFDAVCHTFATLATGGFSTKNASVGAYEHTPSVDAIVILFMVLAGTNFSLFYKIAKGRAREVWRDTELRLYLGIIAGAALIITLAVWFTGNPIVLTTGERLDPTLATSTRRALFTTVSVQTTTGFCVSDFNLWPFLAKAVLFTIMFVGGSAGSTAGGIKVIRIWAVFRILIAEIEHVFRPNVVRPVRLGKSAMDRELKLGTLAFFIGFVLLFAAGALSVMLFEQLHPESVCTFTTAAGASVASLCNVGPGFGGVGAIENYGWLSAPSKVVLSVLMVLGRLEIFAIVVLVSPRFWRSA